MLREYVVSEAMHALGIPTTRSLAVVSTGRQVQRETVLPGAVLARVASSHLRVGTFQYARATGDLELLQRLADHAIARHHPEAAPQRAPALALFDAVVAAQASLVAQWMLVGFIHGVMNTDNMTISGETIDYGPCAFMDAYDPATVFSSIDAGGRYAYGNQPAVAQWNLARLAEALLPLLHEDQEEAIALATRSLEAFGRQYDDAWSSGMRAKLGLPVGLDASVAAALVEELVALLRDNHVDHTSFFRLLVSAARDEAEPVRGLVLDLPRLDEWLGRWRALGPDPVVDGAGEPGVRPSQPPRRGGPRRGHPRRPRAAGPAARRRACTVRRATGARALRRARPRRTSVATTRPSAAPDRASPVAEAEDQRKVKKSPTRPGTTPSRSQGVSSDFWWISRKAATARTPMIDGDHVESDAGVDLRVVHEDRGDRQAGGQVQDRGDGQDGHHPALHVGERLLRGLRPLVAAVQVVRVQQVPLSSYGGHSLVVAHVTSLPRRCTGGSSGGGEVPLNDARWPSDAEGVLTS